jgi:hypothetical protein
LICSAGEPELNPSRASIHWALGYYYRSLKLTSRLTTIGDDSWQHATCSVNELVTTVLCFMMLLL